MTPASETSAKRETGFPICDSLGAERRVSRMDQVSFVDALLPAGFGRNARLERIAGLRRTVCTSTLSPSRSIYAAPPPASPETRALNARSRPARRRTPRSLRLTPQPVQPPGPPTRVLQRSRKRSGAQRGGG